MRTAPVCTNRTCGSWVCGMMRDGGCRSRNGSRGVLFRYCRGYSPVPGAWQKIFDFPIHRRMQICTGNFRNVISRNPRPAALLPRISLQSLYHNARTTSGPYAVAAVQHNARAHTLRTPKHRSHYHNGRRCGRHNPYVHRPLIGIMWGKRRRRPSICARPVHLVLPRV